MSYWGWKPYVPVAARRRKAESAASKAKKAGASLSPVTPSRGAIARTFWGRAWCDNLERYSDFANRLPRGRTYLRNGSVIDLVIGKGEVRAQVVGSRLYRVDVRVAGVGDRHWKAIGTDCAGSIDSMVELLQGTFSKAVMRRLCRPGDGLFPAPKEIEFTCSCPDWASICKHVAAVLYGIGARLDQQPELLFQLRRVDASDLLARAGTSLLHPGKAPNKARVLDESALGDVFGIEMAEVAEVATPRKSVRPVAGQGRKHVASFTGPASNVAVEASKRSSLNSKDHARHKTTANVPSARAIATLKAPPRTRRGVNPPHPRQAIGATRSARAAPFEVTVKQKPNRKSTA